MLLKKIKIFTGLFILILFFSCTDNETKSRTQKNEMYLPVSTGRLDEVMVVMDDTLWGSKVAKLLEYQLQQPYQVLPQYEPEFSIKKMNLDRFKSHDIFPRYRNIVFIGTWVKNNKVSGYAEQFLGKGQKEKLKSRKIYATLHNPWAKPQTVHFIMAPSEDHLISLLNDKVDEFKSNIIEEEHKRLQENLFAEGHNSKAEKKLQEKFGIHFPVPKKYKVSVEEKNFLWLRKETAEISSSLLFREFPLPDTLVEFGQTALKLRDSVGKNYVPGELAGTYMKTDTSLPFIQKTISKEDYLVIKTKGLWRLHKDFMGGPFVNILIIDDRNDRVFMVDGFIYAPKKGKKSIIRGLESLMEKLKLTR